MAALQDQWHADRLKRQQQVSQRRQAVQTQLEDCQQARQVKAVELRQDLATHYDAIKAETNLYLTQAKQQRETQAQRTAAKLKAFDAELQDAVADLRARNQAQMAQTAQYVAELENVTQQTLAGHRRDRAVMRSRQQQKLANYVDELEASVADYLNDVSETRQVAAVADRAQRHRDRAALTDEVDALRDDYAVYRQQMQTFRNQLRQSVWGGNTPCPTPAAAPVPTPSVPSTNGHNGRRVKAKTKTVTPPSPLPSAPPVAQPEVPATNGKTAISIEESVYEYLQSHSEGARLTEIESTLEINRFQAVDALRSLIQKELIVQKDRTYRIQEEAVL